MNVLRLSAAAAVITLLSAETAFAGALVGVPLPVAEAGMLGAVAAGVVGAILVARRKR